MRNGLGKLLPPEAVHVECWSGAWCFTRRRGQRPESAENRSPRRVHAPGALHLSIHDPNNLTVRWRDLPAQAFLRGLGLFSASPRETTEHKSLDPLGMRPVS